MTSSELITATELTDDPTGMAWFAPMMTRAEQAAALIAAHRPASALVSAGQDEGISLALADSGYCSEANLTCPGPDRLIAVGKHRDLERAARGQDTGGDWAARPSRPCATG